MMHNMMDTMPVMAFGMGLVWLFVIGTLGLGIAALVQYLRSDNLRQTS